MITTFQKILKHSLIRYISISILGYSLLSFLMLVFVDIFNISKTISFGISYFILLLLDYMLNIHFVFKTKHNNRMIAKYVLYLISSQIINTWFYSFLISLNINYFLCSYITMLSLFPLKFLASKYFVYK